MKLLASGCSFIYGNELADHNIDGRISQHTFTALLAQDLGLEYHCVAIPGSGSDSHVRKVIENWSPDTKLVVVAWSYANRFEFDFEGFGQGGNVVTGWGPIIEMKLNCPPGADTFIKNFQTYVTDRYTWYNYFKNIVFLQNWLRERGTKYVFCAMDPSFSAESLKHSEYQNLVQSVDWDLWYYWKQDNNSVGFRQWGYLQQEQDSRFRLGFHGHPLEHAHWVTYTDIKKFCQQQGII